MALQFMPRVPLADVGSIAGQLGARRASARDGVRALLDWALLCRVRARERRVLAELDARLLRDIGVPREAARCEARKRFWEA